MNRYLNIAVALGFVALLLGAAAPEASARPPDYCVHSPEPYEVQGRWGPVTLWTESHLHQITWTPDPSYAASVFVQYPGSECCGWYDGHYHDAGCNWDFLVAAGIDDGDGTTSPGGPDYEDVVAYVDAADAGWKVIVQDVTENPTRVVLEAPSEFEDAALDAASYCVETGDPLAGDVGPYLRYGGHTGDCRPDDGLPQNPILP